MSHLTIDRKGKTYHVPFATVQDVIDLMDASYSRRRDELAEDLKAMDASTEMKLEAMNELRSRKGLTADLIREAFTLPGAHEIIKHVVKPDELEPILESAPDEIVKLALLVLGFDVDEDEEAGQATDANPQTGDETSTQKP